MIAFGAAVLSGEVAAIEATLHPDVVLHSPAVFKPYEGRAAVMTVLRAVTTVLEDFRYTASFESADGHVLQFAARAGDREIEGVDIVRVDAAGLVVDLTVLVRPLKGLLELVSRMAAALSAP